ncbi:MAG: hypothetical protein QOI06_2752 [Nocardioidaceae bacterium]|nr:hypothetical protein [Nocardioidaceae bacterium]
MWRRTASARGQRSSPSGREVAGFDVVRHTPLSAAEAWARVTDWERHGDHVPFTTVTLDPAAPAGHELFVARTGVGPLAFDDPMLVAYSRPPSPQGPGIARLVKQGRVVMGWAVLTVTPTRSGSEVRWHEEARLRGTRGPVERLVNVVVAVGFGRLLDGLLC